MKILMIFFGAIITLCAQVTNVAVMGTTATQAIIQFTSEGGNAGACTLAVSESPSLSPLVNDVDPAQFTGANLASRSGNLVRGKTVTFVAGQRTGQATVTHNLSGMVVSRALQTATTHYYQITCGAYQSPISTFQTANLPIGNTYQDAIPADPNNPGEPNWPTLSLTDRTQKIVDPQTGVLYRRISLPYDFVFKDSTNFTAANNSAWTTAANAVTTAGYASISGSTSPLGVTMPNLWDATWNYMTQFLYNQNRIPLMLNVTFSGYSSNAGCTAGNTNDNCAVRLCITLDGATCAPQAKTYDLYLTSSAAAYQAGSGILYDVMRNDSTLWATYDIAARWGGGAMNCDGSTTVRRNGSIDKGLFPPVWGSGSLINLGGSFDPNQGFYSFNGTQYHISSITNAATAVLTSACPAGTYNWGGDNFGIMVWKKTTSADSVYVNNFRINSLMAISLEDTDYSDGDYATQTPVTLSNGDPGSLLLLHEHGQYSLDQITGEVHAFDTERGSMFLQANADWGTNHEIWSLGGPGVTLYKDVYTGDYLEPKYVTNQGAYPLWDSDGTVHTYPCGTGPSPNFQCDTTTAVTQPNAGIDVLAKAFNPAIDTSQFSSWNIVGVNDDGVIEIAAIDGSGNLQWALQWLVMFDPNTQTNVNGLSGAGCVGGGQKGCIVGMMNSWSSPNCRWCEFKEADIISIHGWTSADAVPTDGFPGSSRSRGPFINNMVGTMPAQTACPQTTYNAMYGINGNACATITIDGEPYNNPEGVGSRGKYGAVQVGDAMEFVGNGQIYLVLARTGSQLTIGTIFGTQVSNVPANSAIYWVCNSGLPPFNFSDYDTTVYWNYSADPLGANATGGTILQDKGSYGGHNGWLNQTNTFAGTHHYAMCPKDYSNLCYTSQDVRGVTNFASYLEGDNYSGLAPFSAKWAGMPGEAGIGGTAAIQSHPNGSSVAINAYGNYGTDARPFVGLNLPLVGALSPVSGNLYKLPYSDPAAQALHRRQFSTFASSGRHVLLDISAPNSQIEGTAVYAYDYCIAAVAGECYQNSKPGDVYVNIPYLTDLGCYNQSAGFSTPITLNAEEPDFCIMDNGPELNNIARFSVDRIDPSDGSTMQFLGHGLTHARPSQFWHTHAAAMNTGRWLMTYANGADRFFDPLLAVKVPYPQASSVRRTTFLPVEVNLTSPPGETAAIEFWYAENGAGCTTRNEPCVVSSPKISTASSPTVYPPIRLTGASGNYTDSSGNVWLPSLFGEQPGCFGGGVGAYHTGNPISGTNDPVIYQTQVYSPGCYLEYSNSSIPNGNYTITLKEAETWFGAPGAGSGGSGSRVFNVVINGVTVDSNVDVFARAGGADVALDLTYTINVTGGTGIDIQLQPVTNNPMLDALQIISNTVNPPVFWFEQTDNWSGLACSSGCTIAIPALPEHVLYYRPVYLSGSTISGRGLTQVQAVE